MTVFSIALCTYNGARFLPAQLESILRQTRLPDELIACDDGSTDGTLELLRDFARQAPFQVELRKIDATSATWRTSPSRRPLRGKSHRAL